MRARHGRVLPLLALACARLTAPAGAPETVAPESPALVAEEQHSHTGARLQAISAVDHDVVWVSGLEGTYARTTDGGASWQTAQVPDGRDLQFRDVHAVDANTAYLLAAGPGDQSRILKTGDGGASWRIQYTNQEPAGFLDCFDFWSPERGLAYGDSVKGELFVLATTDGATWSRVAPALLPAAGPGEGGFAASGGCVDTGGDGRAWIATGAAGHARVLSTGDHGATWQFAETPIVRGAAAGLTAVLFLDDRTGIALGGDLDQPQAFTANVAVSDDGGATWAAAGRVSFPGAVYAGAWAPGARAPDGAGTVVAAGPGGISLSADAGATWLPVGDRDTWAVAFGDAATFWAVGPGGRITRYSRPDR